MKSGGKLEYILANLFPSLILGGGAGGKNDTDPFVLQAKRELFQVPQPTIAAVRFAVLQRNEEALAEFLKTGTIALQSDDVAPMTGKAVLASMIQSSRFKVEELMLPQPPDPALTFGAAIPPPSPPIPPTNASHSTVDNRGQQYPATPSHPTAQDGTANSASSAAAALSKESKMEMWKRITEERRAQQEKEKIRLQREMPSTEAPTKVSGEPSVTATASDSPSPMLLAAAVVARHASNDDTAKHTRQSTQSLPPPPPPSPPSPPIATASAANKTHDRLDTPVPATTPLATAKMLNTATEASRESAAAMNDSPHFAGQVKALSEQIATMRKYMKVRLREPRCTVFVFRHHVDARRCGSSASKRLATRQRGASKSGSGTCACVERSPPECARGDSSGARCTRSVTRNVCLVFSSI